MRIAGRLALSGARSAAIAVLLFATLFPFAWMLSTAFKNNSEILVYPRDCCPAAQHWSTSGTCCSAARSVPTSSTA